MEIDDLSGTPPTSHAMEPGSTGNTVNFSPSSRAAAAEDSPMPLIESGESGLSQPMDESGGSAIRNLMPNLLNQQIMDHFYIQPEDIDDNIRMYATSYFKLNKELTSLQQKHLHTERINIPKEEILKRESLTDEVEEIKLGIAGYLAEQEEMGYELEKMGGNESDELELTFDMSGGIKSNKRQSKKRKSKKRKSKKRKKSKKKRKSTKKRKSKKKRSKKSKSKRR